MIVQHVVEPMEHYTALVVTAAVSRILQYHEIPGTPAVLALREGSILRVVGDRAELVGTFHARSAALYNIQTEGLSLQ